MLDETHLSFDALVRSIGINRSMPHAFLLGAGASITSGVPSAERCIWEWKRQIFLTNNPGLEQQFGELSLPEVRKKIQRWLDAQGTFVEQGDPAEYSRYIEECFPIAADRQAFFKSRIRSAKPHIGYRLLCHLAESGVVSSVWTTNFDGLVARAAAAYKVVCIEVGLDSRQRLPSRRASGELLCVALHGDYRYDALLNTAAETQKLERDLTEALRKELVDSSLIVCGYSGRDESIMRALGAAYSEPGSGSLYWCHQDRVSQPVLDLVGTARSVGRTAFAVQSADFDELLRSLAFHCLEGPGLSAAKKTVRELAPADSLPIKRFSVPANLPTEGVVKSNAFEVDLPSEVLEFDLRTWPKQKVWAWLREQVSDLPIAVGAFRGRVLALGTPDSVKDAFGGHLKGELKRTPIASDDLKVDDGVVVSLLREALVRSMAEKANLQSDGRRLLWASSSHDSERGPNGERFDVHDAVLVYLRGIGDRPCVVLKPTLQIVSTAGGPVPREIAAKAKMRRLGYQHNKPFNQALMRWRKQLFPEAKTVFEFPPDSASSFRFRVRRTPGFGQVSTYSGSSNVSIRPAVARHVRYQGIQLGEPNLQFSNRAADGFVSESHPIKGILQNRPHDYVLSAKGFADRVKVGVICPSAETSLLQKYLELPRSSLKVAKADRDYLLDYPGFASAFGVALEVAEPGSDGWIACPEPSQTTDPRAASREIASSVINGLRTVSAATVPSVVVVFIPERWRAYRSYRDESESFDLHDFVKAFGVQRGIATQFLEESTVREAEQCRKWWWLSLALYVKSMRTPWVLQSLGNDTAFVGLGFSLEASARQDQQVTIGCSHIYSDRGEGLQYRLSKIENPIIRQRNPFLRKDDARRLGETIRQLFFDSRMELPRRVVLHKRTPFLNTEREGLREGLTGVDEIELVEIRLEDALRFVASVPRGSGFDEDNFPVKRGTALQMDDYTALLWVHGVTSSVQAGRRYYQGKRRIPTPLVLRRHAGRSDLRTLCEEVLGLSKMNWNTFDLYTKLPATVQSSNEIARIGSLLKRFSSQSYDFRLFI